MKTKRFLISLYAVLLLLAIFPTEAFASGSTAYHPPAITVVSYNAPDDMKILLQMTYRGETFPVTMIRETRAWETSFRVYREGIYRVRAFWGNEKDFAGSKLICRTGGKEYVVPIPQSFLTPGGNQDRMTLDCETWELRSGMPAWRGPLTVAGRVLFVLAVKGLLFLLMGYTQLRSWLCFLGVNLATQLPLNMSLYNMLTVDNLYLYSAIAVASLVILLVEILLLVILVQENNENRTSVYATVSNIAGLAAFVSAISLLPV
jgi:hypothetical protein